MGFPRKIKEQILVDTARHCCVCHRYKGVKVEVHHIVQEALGGKNTYKNAIALCFDCHTDAGHYNNKHPRGMKFSPGELKRAKEHWLKMVKENNIQPPTEPDKFLCQYFVCENYENLVEISSGDLSKFPIENPLLLKNEVLASLNQVIANHPETYRHTSAWGEHYNSKEDYIEKHPDACIPNESNGEYSYFQVIRTPTREELESHASKDGVLKLMIQHDIPIENISSIVGCYEDACAGIKLQEEYIFRKLWCAFLAITNISDRPVALDSIVGDVVIENKFLQFSISADNSTKINLPKVPIKPNSTVLLPLAVVLPPLYSLSREEWSSSSSGGWSDQLQIVTHGSITSKNINDCLTFGGQISPREIRYKHDGNIYSQYIHPFDLTNMYSIDRHWQCGSCPHLFFVNDKVSYVRELLAHCESNMGEDRVAVPKNVRSILIAEIEDEITEIKSILINDALYVENVILKKSEFIEIPILEGSVIKIVGKYIPDSVVNHGMPQGIKRNDIVGQFLFNYVKRPNKANAL